MLDESIQKGSPGDIPGLVTLYDEINDALEAGVNYPGWEKGVYPTRQDAVSGIAEESLFVIKEGARIIASVILNHHQEEIYASVRWRRVCADDRVLVIHILAVHPEYQSQGLAKRLLAFALRYAADHGMESIRLDVYEKNTPAIRLYEACGFAYIATVDLRLSEYRQERFRLYEMLLKKDGIS